MKCSYFEKIRRYFIVLIVGLGLTWAGLFMAKPTEVQAISRSSFLTPFYHQFGRSWYYDIDDWLPKQLNYSESHLLDVVQKGDIIYEPNGFGGVTGHMAIVDARRL